MTTAPRALSSGTRAGEKAANSPSLPLPRRFKLISTHTFVICYGVHALSFVAVDFARLGVVSKHCIVPCVSASEARWTPSSHTPLLPFVGCTSIRIDRSLLISDLLVKKVGGGAATPSKTASDAPATPAGVQTPSKQDQSYTSSASSAPTTPTQDRSAQQPAISSPAPPTASAASSGAASRRAGPGTANDKAPNKAKAGGVGKVVAVVGVIAAVGAVVAFNVLKKK
jgi:hypothetical protein